MMKKNLAVLGLGVLLSATMLTPVNASEVLEGKGGRDFSIQKKFNMEDRVERLNGSLEKLEAAYEDGSVSEEDYNLKKERIQQSIELIESGELPARPEKPDYTEMTKEEKLEKVDAMLAGLEEKYNNGDIDEERYTTAKEKMEDMRVKIENDEEVFFGRKGGKRGKKPHKVDFTNLSQEEILAKIDEKLANLEEKYSAGDLTEEKYTAIKENIQDMRTKVENGEKIFDGKLKEKFEGKKREGFGDKIREKKDGFQGLTKEEHLTKLQEHLTNLDEKLSEGEIDQERYDAVKEKINTIIERIENSEE